MTAILSSLVGGTFSARAALSEPNSRSETIRFRSLMPTGASTSFLVHSSSQRAKQTLPQTAGKGLSFLISSSASPNLPWDIRDT